MKKNLLDLDLQLFAEEAEDAGANEVETTAESQEEETSEDESSETGEEEGGDSEPQEQSAEENARYAAIRRRAEDEARKRYESEIGQLNQRVVAMCNGVTHPVTGQPITNINEYFDALSIQQRQAQEAELQEKGVDPKLIDRMVASNPAVLQAQMYMEQQRQQEQMAEIQRSVEEIASLDPDIKNAEDLWNSPQINEITEFCRRHNATYAEAYKVVCWDKLRSVQNDASRQQAINQMKGKSHLPSQTQNVATENDDDVEVPAEIMARFKADGKTEKQIKELYKRVPH